VSEAITIANPAAGANISYTFEDDYRLDGFAMQLVTAVAVANRRFKWMITDAADVVLARGVASVDQTASLTWQNFSTPGCPSMAAVQALWLGTNFPAAGLEVASGFKFKTSIDNLQAADQLSLARLMVSRLGRLN
jgi:hypothetical protein